MHEKGRDSIIRFFSTASSAYFREWTLAKKLWLGFGLLIFFLGISALVSYWQIQVNKRAILRIVEVQEPLERVSLKMEGAAGDTVEGLSGYLKDRNPASREKANQSAARFENLTAEFNRLAEADRIKRAGQQISLIQGNLKESVNELMSLADERHAVLHTFRQNVKDVDDLINKRMRLSVGRTAPNSSQKLEALLNLKISNDEIAAAVEAYASEASPSFQERVKTSEADFKKYEALYRETTLSPNEKEWLSALENRFAAAVDSGNHAMQVADRTQERVGKFAATVEKIDSYVDNEIQPLVREQTASATEETKEVVEFAATLLLALAAAGISIGLVSAWAVSRAIIKPVSKLVRGTEEIGGGRLDYRIDLHTRDELGELAAAFNKMTENLEKSQRNLTAKTEELQEEIAVRKRVEEALRRLALIVESTDDAIVAKTPDGVIRNWNRGAKALYGYAEQEVQGKHISILSPPDRSDEFPEILEKINRGESVEHFETVRQTKNGDLIEVSLTVSPIRDTDGKIIGASTISHDITRRKRAEAGLRESEQRYRLLCESLEETVRKKVAELQLAETLASIGQMVSVVAHEIRNPLQNIQMGVDALYEKLGHDKDKAEVLDEIGHGIGILNEIVGELLEYSRPVKLQYSSKPVGEIVEQAVRALSHKLHNISTRIELDEKDRVVWVDSVKFSEVLVNVIANAAEAMPDGGELRIHSEFSGNGKGGFLRLSISDTGSGISEEDLSKIGKPFFTTKARGTGLGIPICKKIIEAHKGTFHIKSKAHEGTTVQIEVPVENASAETAMSDKA